MQITASRQGKSIYITLDGEMDEHSAALARRQADKIADDNVGADEAVFDLQNVTFMDSTGIGFLIGRYKKFKRYGVPMYVTNPNTTADKILTISGVYAIIPRI